MNFDVTDPVALASLEGRRIKLVEMPGDPDPIPVGTQGYVLKVQVFSKRVAIPNVPLRGFQRHVPGQWHHEAILGVEWDIQRSLNLILPRDKIRLIPENEVPF